MSKKQYFIRQKLIGAALIILGLLSIPLDSDATAAILMVPMGLYLLLTKEMWLTDEFDECEDGESK